MAVLFFVLFLFTASVNASFVLIALTHHQIMLYYWYISQYNCSLLRKEVTE